MVVIQTPEHELVVIDEALFPLGALPQTGTQARGGLFTPMASVGLMAAAMWLALRTRGRGDHA